MTALPRVLVLDDYERAALRFGPWERLDRRIDLRVLNEPVQTSQLLEAAEGVEILVAMRERTRFDRPLLEKLCHVKLLVTTGHRNPSIDLVAAQDTGITVCDTRNSNTLGATMSSLAELTWALILTTCRRVVENVGTLRGGRWGGEVGASLEGRTLGLFGFGLIGSQVAQIGRAFGMRPIAWSPSLTEARAAASGAVAVSREELFEGSNILSVHARVNPTSIGSIGIGELASMPRDSILINTARAAVIDEQAVRTALDRGILSRVAMDVHWQEPAPADSWYLKDPRVIATPHIGYVVDRSFKVFFNDVVDDIEAYLAGTPIRLLLP